MRLSIFGRPAGLALLSFILCTAVLRPVAAQQPPADDAGRGLLEAVASSISRGDADGVFADAADRVDLTVLGSGNIYSRDQAVYVLAEFFREHPPERFAFDEPSRRDDYWFASGTYRSEASRDPLWLFARLRLNGDVWELRELRIERKQR